MKNALPYALFTFFILLVVLDARSQDTLEVSRLEMNNCLQLYTPNNSEVVSSKEVLDSLIRHDASRDYCTEFLKNVDLDQFSLLGIDIHSGYCPILRGLEYSIVRLDDQDKYVFEITYDKPVTPCRAYSSYHLWLQVPKLVKGYEVEFVVNL